MKDQARSLSARAQQACAGNHLLAALPTSVSISLAPVLHEVSLSQGEVLAEPHSPVRNVYFPHDAVISLMEVMQDGTSIETAAVGCEAALGTGVALGRQRAIGTAVVQLPGRATRLSAADFQAVAAKSPLMRDLAARCDALLMARLHQAVACGSLHRVEERLSRCLLEYSDRTDGKLMLTQERLAHMLGVRRPTLTVIMTQRLRRSGAIRWSRGVIQIRDRAALEASSCECYRAIQEHTRSILSAFPPESSQ